MDIIEWSEQYSVGVDEIDKQHKQLFKMLNSLMSDPAATVDSETISGLLTGMREYVSMHFKAEEEYMLAIEYPSLEYHKKQHKAFQKKTLEMCNRVMAKDRQTSDELVEFLFGWLVNHILRSDKEYAQFAGTCPAQYQHS